MAQAKGTRPRGELPRGKVADDIQVVIYRMLYNADHPLRFHEVMSQLPKIYASDANRWLRKQHSWAAVIPDDAWQPEHSAQAWEGWVTWLLREAVRSKRVSSAPAPDFDGTLYNAKKEDKVWTANRDHPPMVRTDITVTKIVPWTPFIGKAGVRATMRRRFLVKADAALKIPGLHKDAKDLIKWGQIALDDKIDPDDDV